MKSCLLIAVFACAFFFFWGVALATEPRSLNRIRNGSASWYGEEYRGRLMANGKPFNPDALTCAIWDYPFGTRLRVWAGGYRSIDVTVTDRGPDKKLKRLIDLSEAAFAALAPTDVGLLNVTIAVLDARGVPVVEI
jgi:rare lipoprotein A